nr:MAG TPA: hypothetical protein [Caudoviricetes sp.]
MDWTRNGSSPLIYQGYIILRQFFCKKGCDINGFC